MDIATLFAQTIIKKVPNWSDFIVFRQIKVHVGALPFRYILWITQVFYRKYDNRKYDNHKLEKQNNAFFFFK